MSSASIPPLGSGEAEGLLHAISPSVHLRYREPPSANLYSLQRACRSPLPSPLLTCVSFKPVLSLFNIHHRPWAWYGLIRLQTALRALPVASHIIGGRAPIPSGVHRKANILAHTGLVLSNRTAVILCKHLVCGICVHAAGHSGLQAHAQEELMYQANERLALLQLEAARVKVTLTDSKTFDPTLELSGGAMQVAFKITAPASIRGARILQSLDGILPHSPCMAKGARSKDSRMMVLAASCSRARFEPARGTLGLDSLTGTPMGLSACQQAEWCRRRLSGLRSVAPRMALQKLQRWTKHGADGREHLASEGSVAQGGGQLA
eukprot:CAMPEP_0206278124 /NCGR_PEP_ID=MMETSP0047_2-20121206/37247_1 /ASSEMBLY_ACC=CAM_ASM_000192 /TAXON_ID=195065 /ORGANISM="Chroomonas mesostigmatica_cf, Strain CCMP1168" /LENGTH=320 /DNA_ID=CAMNT_0053707837 /DNA_START=304 /DNA_END=1265 /DNA_ORIENTATION=+